MDTQKSWMAALLLGAALVQSLSAASQPWFRGQTQKSAGELKLWKAFESDSKFVTVPHSSLTTTCEFSTPPQPLTTPDPLIDDFAAHKGLTVSFVIGADGLVHSALLLKSGGDDDDRAVLNVVRSWRYRPAMCNGVPAETEATVDFSSHRRGFGLE